MDGFLGRRVCKNHCKFQGMVVKYGGNFNKMLGKIVKIGICLILPKNVYKAVMERWNKTKLIMTSDFSLKIFWRILGVLFFPVILLCSILVAFSKTILLWCIGPKHYRQVEYAFSMFFKDMTSEKERKTFPVAIKRLKLFYELVTKGKEREVSYGDENPDKTFYVIRPYYFLKKNELSTLPARLMYNYYRNLHFIAYAINKGWIPVVDWENYGMLDHQEEYPINGTKNGWEYFWKQPSAYSLEEVYKSKNVVLSTRNTLDTSFIPPCKYPKPYQKNAEECAKKCKQYDKLIQFNKFTLDYINEKVNNLFPQNARILGVSMRGTDYKTLILPGHPEQPEIEDLICYIKKYMWEWDMEYIFIACEAQGIIDAVKKEFGNKVIVLPRKRYLKEPEVGNNPLYVSGQRYQTNLDYVTEMAMLSKCTSLLASYSGGVRIAVIWNRGKYEHIKII